MREGVVAMLGPFIDTLIICTITGLVIVITGVWDHKRDGELSVNEVKVYPAQLVTAEASLTRRPGCRPRRAVDAARAPVRDAKQAREQGTKPSAEQVHRERGRRKALLARELAADAVRSRAWPSWPRRAARAPRTLRETIGGGEPFTGAVQLRPGRRGSWRLAPQRRPGGPAQARRQDAYRARRSPPGLSSAGWRPSATGAAMWWHVSVFLFALSTIISWSYYGDRAVEYLGGLPLRHCPTASVYVVFVYVGSVSALEVVWSYGDWASP